MLDEQFKSITGFRPAEHQARCLEALASGKSVILRASTGSGKSEAVWIPFLAARGQKLPMIFPTYSALRTLADFDSLERLFEEYRGS